MGGAFGKRRIMQMQKVILIAATYLTVAGAMFATTTASLAKTMVYVSAATDGEINTYSMDCWFPCGTEPVFPPRSEPPLTMVL